MSQYTVRIAKSNADLDQLQSFWSAQSSGLENVPDFFRLVIELRDNINTPYVVVVQQDDQPVAMMLCRLEDITMSSKFAYYEVARHKVRSLTAIYNGLVGDITDATVEMMTKALEEALTAGDADLISFRGVREGSILERAVTKMRTPALRRFIGQPDVHRTLEFPEDFTEVLAMRSSSNRKRIRRYKKRIEEIDGFRLEVIDQPEDLQALMDDVEIVAKKTYQRGLKSGFFNNQEWEKLLRLGFDNEWFTLWVVYGDGKPLTYAGGYSYKGTFYSFLKGFDPDYGSYSVGTYLLLQMIEDLMARGEVSVLDYGFGDADYKRLFSNDVWNERSHQLFAPKFRTTAIAVSVKSVRGFSSFVQRIANKWNLEARIKKILRRQKSDT